MGKRTYAFDGSNWVGLTSTTADLSQYANMQTTQFGFRNKIINGDFRINQRLYTSGTFISSGTYSFDRWKAYQNNTSITFTSAPQGQIVTFADGSRGVQQIIERENISAGTYVLSWSGTALGRVYNSGTTAPAYAASPVVVTLDGTANVIVDLGNTTTASVTAGRIQLEQGTIPTPFEQRPIGTELALCQRYCYVKNGNTSTDAMWGWGRWESNNFYAILNHPVQMRVAPSFTLNNVSGLQVVDPTVAWYNVSSISAIHKTGTMASDVLLTMSGASVANKTFGILAVNSGSPQLIVSAEL